MKTTLILDDNLLQQVMHIYGLKTKTKTIELALQQALNTAQRRQIAQLYGALPHIKKVPRR